MVEKVHVYDPARRLGLFCTRPANTRRKEKEMTEEEKKKVSKAQQKAVNKYMKNNYDRINVTFPKGKKEEIEAAAEAAGESVNNYIRESVRRRMESGT